ncbi:treacle protein [Mantella aurantiaca]
MVKAKGSLLALIHQHLLKNGYCKSARELQIESGEKFATSKVTLMRVYKLWTKKSKKKKKKKKTKIQDGAKSKKAHDPKNSEGQADLVQEAKKSSDVKAKKDKKVKKKMNLATLDTADVKMTPKKARSSVNTKPGTSDALVAAGLPDGNDSSDSKEETASANAAPTQAAKLKSKPAVTKSDESSSNSESEEEINKQGVLGKSIPVTGAAMQKHLSKASNGKAEVGKSSESDDETDIDKVPASATAKPTASSNVQPAKTKSQAAPPAQQVQADSSTETSESDDEEEPVKQVVTQTSKLASPTALSAAKLKEQRSLPAPQSKVESSSERSESDSEEEPVKQDKTSTKAGSTVKASPTKPAKGQSKSTTAAQASALKAQVQRKILVSETEIDSSGSEEEKKTPSLITSRRAVASPLTPVMTAKAVVRTQETSEEESSNDEETAIKQKVPSSGKTQKPLALPSTPVVAAKAKTPLKPPKPAEESSEEESSDNDVEPSTKTPATVIPPSQPKTLSQGVNHTPVVSAKSPLKSAQVADESSEESSSDSNEEPPAKTPATVIPPLQPKTFSQGINRTPVVAAKSPLKLAQVADESSEEESSDSDEKPPVKLGQKPSTPLHPSHPDITSKGTKQTTSKTLLKIPQPTNESSEEESDSDNEPTAKKPAAVLQSPQSKTLVVAAKQTSVMIKSKSLLKTSEPASESSEEDSDSGEEPAATNPATVLHLSQPNTPSGGVKQAPALAKSKNSVKTTRPADESSEEESESEDEPATKNPATVQHLSQPNTPSGGVKQAPILAKSKNPVKTTRPADESSEEESESEDEPATKTLDKALQSTQPKTFSRGAKQKPVMTKTPIKIPQPGSESSEEESESDEEPTAKTIPAAPFKMSASDPSVLTVKPSAAIRASDSDADSESSESSDMEHKKGFKSNTQTTRAASVKAPEGKPAIPGKLVTELKPTASDSSDSDKEEKTKAKPATVLSRAMVKSTVSTALQQDESSEESESSSDEEPLKLAEVKTVETQKAKPSASFPKTTAQPVTPAVTVLKEQRPVAGKPTAVSQAMMDSSESSESSDDADLPLAQVVTPTPSFGKSKSGKMTGKLAKPSIPSNAATAKSTNQVNFTPALKKVPTESTSETSDSDSSEETAVKVNTPITAVKTAKANVSEKLKTPNVTSPVPGKTASSLQKAKQTHPESSSESSDSEEEPSVKKVASPAPIAVKGRQGSQTDKLVKTPLAPKPLPSKPNGNDESSTEATDSEEDTAGKVAIKEFPKAVEQSVKTSMPSTEVKGRASSLSRSPAVRKPATNVTSSSSSESDDEPAKKPTLSTAKPASQPSVGKTITPITAVLLKKQESSSEESDSDEEETVQKLTSSLGKTQKKPEPAAKLTKVKSPSPAKSLVVTKADDSSDTASSDSEEVPVKDKGAATGSLSYSQKSIRSVSKLSSTDVKNNKSAVPPTPSGGSKQEDSQPPTIATPKKRKRASETARISDEKKKEAKIKGQPNTIATLPAVAPPGTLASTGALLESEEETVLALLEGRSPKKTKKNKVSKKVSKTAVVNVVTPSVQNNNAPEKSPLPQPLLSSAWTPESPTSGDKSSLPTTEVLPLSDKKAKKRKNSQNELEKLKQKSVKKAKKEKKEKKIQKGIVEGANVSQKPKPDKKKSEKDRSKKKTKTKEGKKHKEGKQKAETTTAAVVESTDSGIGLSKPKKKRKS